MSINFEDLNAATKEVTDALEELALMTVVAALLRRGEHPTKAVEMALDARLLLRARREERNDP